ncbi:hypothetical protein J7E73_09075 [Paenibacillus albidus]|uniref:hypothetical protein n=1 Tax=Paenibacillus albidus TaxID=2041023 RepID=UPI001BE6E005|nr:hypothetical protein [Paenibacillus albidus]MBT2289284.1 hypothetical protein [Paenibacillus albidus]
MTLTKEPGIALKLDYHVELSLPPIRAGFSDDGRLTLRVGSDSLAGDMFLADILETIIANESFVYMYLNDDVLSLCNLLLKSELILLSERLKEHFAITIDHPVDPFQPEGIVRLLGLDAASISNETNKDLLLKNLNDLLVRRFGIISDTGKHREAYGYNRALEINNEGISHPTLKVTFNKDEGALMFLDSHFKAEVFSTYGNTAIGVSETVNAIAKTITAFERIIPQLGMYYALSQAQIALLRLGWGLEDLKLNDSVLKNWISGATAKLVPTRRMPSETTILYFMKATLADSSEVNGMWPNTLSADLFYNLESGHVEKYVSEHEHYLELKDGKRFTIAGTVDGGVSVRAVSDHTADTHHILHFYNDTESLDKGLLLAGADRTVSLLGQISNTASSYKTVHLRAPRGKEFRFVMWGSNNFDVYLVEEGQGGVYTINDTLSN